MYHINIFKLKKNYSVTSLFLYWRFHMSNYERAQFLALVIMVLFISIIHLFRREFALIIYAEIYLPQFLKFVCTSLAQTCGQVKTGCK